MGQVAARGAVRFRGEEHRRAASPTRSRARGLGYVPEDRAIFPDLTVRQNLALGRKRAQRPGALRR